MLFNIYGYKILPDGSIGTEVELLVKVEAVNSFAAWVFARSHCKDKPYLLLDVREANKEIPTNYPQNGHGVL